MKRPHSRGVYSLGSFYIELRTPIELLLAFDSTEIKGLALIGGCCGCMLRVDFHTADGITNGRWLAFHDSPPEVGSISHFKLSAQQFDAPLAYSLVCDLAARRAYEPGSRQPSLSVVPEVSFDVVLYLFFFFRGVTVRRRYQFEP